MSDLKAHALLDKAVDSVFGLKNPTPDQRLAALFVSYQKLTTEQTLKLPKSKTAKKPKT